MKALISILIILVTVYAFMQLVGFYNRTAGPQSTTGETSTTSPAPNTQDLPGLPSYLEASLAQAHREGAESLGKWLKQWHKHVQDPRLAAIELDYVVLLNIQNHAAARERFQQVRARINPDSPVYPRVKSLEPAYEQ